MLYYWMKQWGGALNCYIIIVFCGISLFNMKDNCVIISQIYFNMFHVFLNEGLILKTPMPTYLGSNVLLLDHPTRCTWGSLIGQSHVEIPYIMWHYTFRELDRKINFHNLNKTADQIESICVNEEWHSSIGWNNGSIISRIHTHKISSPRIIRQLPHTLIKLYEVNSWD